MNSDVQHSNDEEYIIAPGTTFAYMLHKPQWDFNRKNKRKKIIALRADQHGPP